MSSLSLTGKNSYNKINLYGTNSYGFGIAADTLQYSSQNYHKLNESFSHASEYEEKLNDIDNNIKLTDNQKALEKSKIVDKLLPDRWKYRYCCRARLISYVDLIKVII
jgi:DNA-directed RNA polymerase subunit N (RpoN/RPB10)